MWETDGLRLKVCLCRRMPVSTPIFGGKSHSSLPGRREEETPSSLGNLCPAFRQKRGEERTVSASNAFSSK